MLSDSRPNDDALHVPDGDMAALPKKVIMVAGKVLMAAKVERLRDESTTHARAQAVKPKAFVLTKRNFFIVTPRRYPAALSLLS